MQEVSSKTINAFDSFSVGDMAIMYRTMPGPASTHLHGWATFYQIPEEDAETMLALCKACHDAGF